MAQLSRNKKIVIFGGSFDPIHQGHIDFIKTIISLINPEKFYLVPTFKHRYKAMDASFDNRVKMIELAIASCSLNGFVEVSDADKTIIENKKKGLFLTDNRDLDFNTSLETTIYFKKLFPDAVIYYPLGSDNISAFNTFYKADTLSEICQIVEITRNSDIVYDSRLAAICINNKITDISSSDIRRGKSLLTPVQVLNYILDNDLYFTKKMHSYLSLPRFEHSVSVARTAYLIALKNNLNPLICFQAGLFHDIAKDLVSSQKISMMKKYYPKYSSFPKFSYHQFLSCYIAKHEFNIDSKKILKAILYHCTGNKNLNPIEKCIYVADKAEPLREYNTKHLLEAALNDLDDGFIQVIKDQREFLIKEKKEYLSNPWTRNMYEQYLNIKENSHAKK